MKKNNLIRFAHALAVLPLVLPGTAVSIPSRQSAQSVLVQKLNTGVKDSIALNQAVDSKAQTELIEAEAIDAYFKAYGMPLYGTGLKMVQEAGKYGLDWRLIPAIAVRESTGGKFQCKNVGYNPFGWGSCTIGFKSYDQAIETIARNLGGEEPGTTQYYENKSTIEILHAYNPPTIVKRYAEQVISIMNDIGTTDMAKDNQVADAKV